MRMFIVKYITTNLNEGKTFLAKIKTKIYLKYLR